MKTHWIRILAVVLLALSAGCLAANSAPPAPAGGAAGGASVAGCPALLGYSFPELVSGQPVSLCSFSGKVILVVNTASHCGFTPQYEGLEALYRRYRERGLVVVGFPSNDFGSQEPGANQEIAEFCQLNYGVSFPMFEKTDVVGRQANALYAALAGRTGERPGWNFHKYLIDRHGSAVRSFSSEITPGDPALQAAIEGFLRAQ
jgi:glutathione peroxidase